MKRTVLALALLLSLSSLVFANCERIEIRNKTILLEVNDTGSAVFDVLIYAQAELRGSCNISVEAVFPPADGVAYSIGFAPKLLQPRTYDELPARIKVASQNAPARSIEGTFFANDTTSSKSDSARILLEIAAPFQTPAPSETPAPEQATTPTPQATQLPPADNPTITWQQIALLTGAMIVLMAALYAFYSMIQR